MRGLRRVAGIHLKSMNSQSQRTRLSASQGAARTPTNFIQRNKEMLAKLAQQKHQATPMPGYTKGSSSRHCSQPPPKLTKVKPDPVSIVTSRLPTVCEADQSQSSRKKTPGEVFLEKIYGEDIPAAGATYEELSRGRIVSKSPGKDLAKEFGSGGKVSFTPLAVARERKSPQKENAQTAIEAISQTIASVVITPKETPQKTTTIAHISTPITHRPPQDQVENERKALFPDQSAVLPLDQTYASSRKSLLASQTALQTEVSPATVNTTESRKSTPMWNPGTKAGEAVESSHKDDVPMQEIKLFTPKGPQMQVEAYGSKQEKTPSPCITPKSILKKPSNGVSPAVQCSAKAASAPMLADTESSNTDVSEAEDGPKVFQSCVLSTPVQKRKRFNAALLSEFDIPLEAFSDCDIVYNAEIKSYSAKRRKRGK